ncbi:hypothetical protein [Mycoplasma sp. HU2014]|nr:hypothetical protein [Mycoplasma sp. HU2014]
MKKIFKWITIISILMPTALVLPVFHIYKSNKKAKILLIVWQVIKQQIN